MSETQLVSLMMRSLIILIVFHFFPYCSSAQIDTSHYIFVSKSTPDTTILAVSLKDNDNVPFGHYVSISQYFEQIRVMAEIGEPNIRNSNGDTLNLFFDHPLRCFIDTSGLLVYENNSLLFANEYKTNPFTLSSTDTLCYSLDYGFEPPYRNPDGSIRTREQDTTYCTVQDTIKYFIELIDGSTSDIVSVIDSVVFFPVSEAYKFSQSVIPEINAANALDYIERRKNFTDTAIVNHALRLRLHPIYQLQLRGEFSRRSFLARLNWSERHSKFLKSRYDVVFSKGRAIFDSISMANKFVPSSSVYIYPSWISISKPTITLSLNGLHAENIEYWLFSMMGDLLSHGDLKLTSTTDSYAMRLALPPAYTGLAHLVFSLDDRSLYKLVFIKP
jgi:hypothetical protein